MAANTPHIVKSFDEDLERLNRQIVRMGELAVDHVATVVRALDERDGGLAGRLIAEDAAVDGLEREVHQQTVAMLARRQPVADDLRAVVAALRISGDLERVGDYATNIAKRVLALNQLPPVRPVAGMRRLGELACDLLGRAVDAYVRRDAEAADAVWSADQELDDAYSGIFRDLVLYMVEDPRTISSCAHLVFVAKNLERIGDHATNIAESVHYLIEGAPLAAERPKGDRTAEFAAARPPQSPPTEDNP
jgi:phosphate transport system protein